MTGVIRAETDYLHSFREEAVGGFVPLFVLPQWDLHTKNMPVYCI